MLLQVKSFIIVIKLAADNCIKNQKISGFAKRHIKKPLFGEVSKVALFPKRSWAAVLSYSRSPPFYMIFRQYGGNTVPLSFSVRPPDLLKKAQAPSRDILIVVAKIVII